MESLYACCAGLDVHKQAVVACLLRPDGDGDGERKEIQTVAHTPATTLIRRAKDQRRSRKTVRATHRTGFGGVKLTSRWYG